MLRHVIIGCVATGAFLFSLYEANNGRADSRDEALLREARTVFRTLPKDAGTAEFPVTRERTALGRLLYFEPRITAYSNMSCAGCHQPAFYGTFPAAFCFGVQERTCNHNVPTPLNAALEFANNWNANRRNVEDQARQAMTVPIGSGLDEKSVVDRVKQIPDYVPLFRAAFADEADPITLENMGKAVGAWERTLLTPSPFDAFLEGKIDALSPQARRGLDRFMSAGCVGCHNGVGIGGGSIQKFGIFEEYWKATQSKNIDRGRATITKRAEDEYMFKVPMLRNVAQTPPYFHDGSADTLPEAVAIMARVQLGLSLSEADRNDIVAFLESLTGERPAEFVTIPALPQVAAEIPK